MSLTPTSQATPPWIQTLRDALKGEVLSDPVSLAVYSVDASIYEIPPLAVAIPQDQEDLHRAVLIAKQHQIPIIPRGAATGITGGAIGKGLIIDTAEYLHHIRHIDPTNRQITCEPGVVQSQLNAAVAPYGLRLGPDTSTGNRATVAGMLANNSAGARSLRYGSMLQHILEVHLLLATGERLHLKPLDAKGFQEKCRLETQEGHIYRTLAHLREKHALEIKARYPPLPRRSSGYALDALLGPFPLNLARLIAGCEGTLGIITEMSLALVPTPGLTNLLVLSFDTLEDALEAVVPLLNLKPLALELLDARIIEAALRSPAHQSIPFMPCTMLIMELDAATLPLLQEKVQAAQEYVTRHTRAKTLLSLQTPEEQGRIWKVREAGLGLLLSKRSYKRAIAFIEDLSIPPQQLSAFMREFLPLLRREGKEAAIYGHVGAGCIHIRPYVDLRDSEEHTTMQRLMEETTQLILRFSGALSGEHGDGLLRAWLNPMLFGPEVMHCFSEIKQAFDPEGRMNPGKIIPISNPQGPLTPLRLSPETKIRPLVTFLDFSREGGLPLSVDLCNGNGQCRKQEGLMCPSFQAYGKEWHTTRARAQGLRAWMHEQLPNTPETSEKLLSLLEYCIECKGCKRDCPSQVDMAKWKAEFLYQHQQKAGVPLRSRLFAHLGTFYALASFAPRFSNWLLKRRSVKALLERFGITRTRPLPPVARQRFSTYCKTAPSKPAMRSVVLCLDTYTEFLEPSIGRAAKGLLEALGYEVIVPSWRCCGRTFFSKGLLKQARARATAFLNQYAPYAERGLPLLHLEPSCFSMVDDDMEPLCQEAPWHIVKQATLLFDQFVLNHFGLTLPDWLDFSHAHIEIDLHVHCHEKALKPYSATRTLLKRCVGVTLHEIDMGCCGLAGSFGYEKEHTAFSMHLGEKKLFSTLRTRPTGHICIANGLSCRNQIRDGTALSPMHIAEWLFQCHNRKE